MPTYTLQAPNGKTYNIDGPVGASEDAVRAEILRRDPSASAVSPAPKPATFMDTLGRAAFNLPGDAFNTLKSIATMPGLKELGGGDIIGAAKYAPQYVHAAGDLASNAAQILQGGVQHVRELSPQGFQGDAPKMDTGAYDKFASDNYDKYGTKENIYKTVGDHPLGPALAVASVAAPVLKIPEIADAVAATGRMARNVAGSVSKPLGVIASAGRNAASAADAMKVETRAGLGAGVSTSAADAAAAQDQAAQAAQAARRSRTYDATYSARRAQAEAASVPPEPAIGDPRQLSDTGDSVRQPAMAKQDEIEAKMRAGDDKYRSAMDAVVADRKAAGVGVSDGDAAKELIAKSKAIVEPDPVTRASVGNVPADSAGAKLRKGLLDALEPKEVPVTVEQGKALTQQGIQVNKGPNGFTRTIKPGFKEVDDYRRFLGKVLNGNVEGYEAINRAEAGSLYGDVSKVLDEYVGGAREPVQRNWAEAKKALEPYEKVRAGQGIVGTQGDTGVASVPASKIPGRIIAGGRDTVNQASAVAGPAPVAAALRTQTQNAFAGVKKADTLQRLVAPGTELGDAISTDGDLVTAVKAHIRQVRDAEASGVKATEFGQKADAASKRAESYDKVASALRGDASNAADAAGEYQRKLGQLEVASPRDVGSHYISMLNDAHKAGRISIGQYNSGLELAKSAETNFARKATRDAWLRRAAGIIGIGSLSTGAAKVYLGGGH